MSSEIKNVLKSIEDDKTLISQNPIMTYDNTQVVNLEIQNPDSYYPHTEMKTFLRIKYMKIGRTYAFNFNSMGIPKFVIGPSWPFFIILMSIIIIGGSALEYFIFSAYLPLILECTYFLFLLLMIGVYITNFLVNPGLVLPHNNMGHEGKYCIICKLYIPEDIKAEHCSHCDVCIQDLDHHCVWMSKCVGKGNKCWFYGFIITVLLFYINVIAGVIYFNYLLKNQKK